jgi:arylsulfatase A-like enzyme/Tfp pilus assembly protein PilF
LAIHGGLILMSSFLRAIPILLLLAGCTRAPERAAPGPAPAGRVPIFIISIDTLRSDRLPAYGYTKGSTPALDRFRSDAVLFRYAFSHCPQTLPAHASLFTGTLPPEHGVRDNIGYAVKSADTLPAALRANGYATGAAVSSYVLRRSTGIAAGFDFFDDDLQYEQQLIKTSAERDGDRSREALQRWIESTSNQPLFGFLHLYEPHAPYTPPPPFDKHADSYDGEVSRADEITGRFLDFLRQRGLYDPALIIVLSDHGEGLGDHGEQEHGLFVYRESIQVPLLIKLPHSAQRGSTVDAPVGLSDVMPTILARLGLPSPSTVSGLDLLGPAAVPPSRKIYAESYFPRLHFGWHELKTLVDHRFHFIDAPKRELYAYRQDPAEATNILDANRREAFAWARELEAFGSFAPPSAVDPEDQRKLAALGYIGSGGGSAGAGAADPKDKIAAFRSLRRGFDLVLNGREREAVPMLRELVQAEPDMVDGWWLLAQSLRKTSRRDEARRSLTEALTRFPTNTNLALAMADLLYESGDQAGGRRHAELAMGRDPVLGGEQMARAELKLGNLDLAKRAAEKALAAAPDRTETLVLLADIARKGNDPGEELRLLERSATLIAERRLAPIAGLNFRRGEALLGAGRVRESEQAFRLETEQFSSNYQAWSSLALVVGAQGRRDESRAILRRALELNPRPRMLALAVESLETMSDDAGARQLQSEFGRRM